jgi:hypothetical protein
MIIFIEYGRLGNQLFQYAALKTIGKEEQLYLIGFDSLSSLFDGIETKFPLQNNSFICRSLKKIRPNLNHLLENIRLFKYLKEHSSENKRYIEVQSGLIPQIKYCGTLFCQSEDFFDPSVIDNLKIKSHFLQKAKEKLDPIYSHNKTPIFVHVRRGDYCRWPSTEHPAVLPADWYYQCITEMRQHYKNPFFIFTSDDIPYVEDIFKMDNGMVSGGSQEEDFALMSLCEGGILSASSFSWWAAYFAKKQSGKAIFFAPTYWGGHRNCQWHPSVSIKSSFLEYIPVK